jgi:hypothetical protein
MVIIIREIGKIIKLTAREYIYIKTELDTKDNGLMISRY